MRACVSSSGCLLSVIENVVPEAEPGSFCGARPAALYRLSSTLGARPCHDENGSWRKKHDERPPFPADDDDARGMHRGLSSYGDTGFSLFLRKAFIKGAGYTDDALDRP